MNRTQENNFDLVRFLLAFTVLFVHSSELSGIGYNKFFSSYIAVQCFFVISGYLVTNSYIYSKNLRQFFKKRFFRIYPAYFAVVLISYIFLSLYFNGFAALMSLKSFGYITWNLILLNFMHPEIAGVFAGNEFSFINGALWTIKVEVGLYLITPILCILFSINKWLSLASVFIFGCIWKIFFLTTDFIPFSEELSRQVPAQLPYYALGAFISFAKIKRDSLILVTIITGVLYFLLKGSIFQYFIEPIFISTFILLLCLSPGLGINITRFGDLSYGIYLIHFPIIQFIVSLNLYKFSPFLGFILSSVISILCAATLWNFIEKRAISYGKK